MQLATQSVKRSSLRSDFLNFNSAERKTSSASRGNHFFFLIEKLNKTEKNKRLRSYTRWGNYCSSCWQLTYFSSRRQLMMLETVPHDKTLTKASTSNTIEQLINEATFVMRLVTSISVLLALKSIPQSKRGLFFKLLIDFPTCRVCGNLAKSGRIRRWLSEQPFDFGK
jgi:hypothetical protein